MLFAADIRFRILESPTRETDAKLSSKRLAGYLIIISNAEYLVIVVSHLVVHVVDNIVS